MPVWPSMDVMGTRTERSLEAGRNLTASGHRTVNAMMAHNKPGATQEEKLRPKLRDPWGSQGSTNIHCTTAPPSESQGDNAINSWQDADQQPAPEPLPEAGVPSPAPGPGCNAGNSCAATTGIGSMSVQPAQVGMTGATAPACPAHLPPKVSLVPPPSWSDRPTRRSLPAGAIRRPSPARHAVDTSSGQQQSSAPSSMQAPPSAPWYSQQEVQSPAWSEGPTVR